MASQGNLNAKKHTKEKLRVPQLIKFIYLYIYNWFETHTHKVYIYYIKLIL